jgi:hypothetical protein
MDRNIINGRNIETVITLKYKLPLNCMLLVCILSKVIQQRYCGQDTKYSLSSFWCCYSLLRMTVSIFLPFIIFRSIKLISVFVSQTALNRTNLIRFKSFRWKCNLLHINTNSMLIILLFLSYLSHIPIKIVCGIFLL